ncbi:MAG: glycine cleavage system regulatory protein [Rhodothermales bacterium]|jgi:glycine cleavage system regulatory protein
MAASLVLTVIGPDKPGIVSHLAAILEAHGGNWIESRMAHLAGSFAGMVQVEVAEPDGLIAALEAVSELRIHVELAGGGSTQESRAMIQLLANDRPGIVHEISEVLSGLSVNVEELLTSCEAAPMGTGNLFRANLTVGLPEGVSTETLGDALLALSDDLMVDFSSE